MTNSKMEIYKNYDDEIIEIVLTTKITDRIVHTDVFKIDMSILDSSIVHDKISIIILFFSSFTNYTMEDKINFLYEYAELNFVEEDIDTIVLNYNIDNINGFIKTIEKLRK